MAKARHVRLVQGDLTRRTRSLPLNTLSKERLGHKKSRGLKHVSDHSSFSSVLIMITGESFSPLSTLYPGCTSIRLPFLQSGAYECCAGSGNTSCRGDRGCTDFQQCKISRLFLPVSEKIQIHTSSVWSDKFWIRLSRTDAPGLGHSLWELRDAGLNYLKAEKGTECSFLSLIISRGREW